MVVPENSINNIMGGLESTGGVRLHTHRRKLKQRFDIIKKLGQGTYGKVQLGVNKETGQEVAIKTIKKCKIETEADLIRIRREIQIMSSLRHPYIIHIYEVFENKDKMVLVMEYAAGGELYDYLSERKVLQENEARRIFRQIAMAVYYCHKHQICHRDLKLENILLDEEGNAKIADFGLSNVFDSNRLLSTFCGSPLYASPEIVKGIPYNGPEVDCWSLGVLLYTLVYGTMPFDGSNFKRLVRQISQGEYYEPKTPSNASKLIGALLTVKGSERLDISGVCKNSWLNNGGEESCMKLAMEFSCQTPVRLDLLLALAPQSNRITAPVPEEVTTSTEKLPKRSLSLGSLATTAQPDFAAQIKPKPKVTPEEDVPEVPEPVETKKKEKKVRERSTSRTRKKEGDSDTEKPKKRSVKKKKAEKENSITESNKEVAKVLEEAKKISEKLEKEEAVAAAVEAAAKTEREPAPPEPPQPAPEKVTPAPPPPSPKVDERKPEQRKKPSEKPAVEPVAKVETTEVPVDADTKTPETPKPLDSVRRKSKVFEAAEMFSQKSPTQEKVTPKKVYIPGVKVSDAKAAFERRSSVTPNEKKPDFNLASTIHLDKLVQSELKKEDQVIKDEERVKKENAIKVITNAIEGEKKASTLPRRKPTRPELKPVTPTTPKAEPEHMVANTKVSQVIYPTPVPAPRPSLMKQESVPPRERIIPIRIEEREEDKPTTPQTPNTPQTPQPHPGVLPKQSSISSKTSSASLGRQDSDSSCGEPIRKSPREVIIPIAVEGGGYVTPSPSALQRISSVTESEEEPQQFRGFGLRSTRRKVQLDTADSVSSDEDDDNFEILTAENLFSTLLSRVRSLTQRLNDDETRPAFPRLFNHSLFDNHARRLTEARSFSQADRTPWRRKRDRDSGSSLSSSSSTLPRDFTTKSLRRLLSQEGVSLGRWSESGKSCEKPPVYQRKFSRTVSDSVGPIYENGEAQESAKLPPLSPNKTKKDGVERKISCPASIPLQATIDTDSTSADGERLDDFLLRGRLSSLERVRKYLDEIQRNGEESVKTAAKSGPPAHRSHSLDYDSILSKYARPKTVYVPNYSAAATDFDRYLDYKRSSLPEASGYATLRRSHIPRLTTYQSTAYRRGAPAAAPEEKEKTDRVYTNGVVEREPGPRSVLEKYGLSATVPASAEAARPVEKTRRPSTLTKPEKEKPKESPKISRIDKAIGSLRRNSVGRADHFSESKLLKRAVSLEDLKKEEPTPAAPSRNRRASSLRPEDNAFEKKSEKKVKTTKKGGVFESLSARVEEEREKPKENGVSANGYGERKWGAGRTPTADSEEAVSQTDNSDSWSSSEVAEPRSQPESAVGDDRECVSERIRRKSFFTRFNQPSPSRKFTRSQSGATGLDRKRYL